MSNKIKKIKGERIDNVNLIDKMAEFQDDPYGFAVYAFQWGKGELEGKELRKWQADFLKDWGKAIKERGFNGIDVVKPLRMAVKSGHGVGKSALVAIVILFILSTRPKANGVVTAVKSEQLSGKTFRELGIWHKRCITGHWFDFNNGKGSMYLRHKKDESWGVNGYNWDKSAPEAFQGQHEATSTSFYLFDEASGIDPTIFETANGGMMLGEPMMFAFGNPNYRFGTFFDIWNNPAIDEDWIKYTINCENVKEMGKENIDYIKRLHLNDPSQYNIRVLGEFPNSSHEQFIPHDICSKAQERAKDNIHGTAYYKQDIGVIGVDPARQGNNETTIVFRKGNYLEVLNRIAMTDDYEDLAHMLANYQDDLKAKHIFIDQGGGGDALYAVGKSIGRMDSWHLVDFGKKSPSKYYKNMRCYMWNEMKKWIREGGHIPSDTDGDELVRQACSILYSVEDTGVTKLESKKDAKDRGIKSPDLADALAVTFFRNLNQATNMTANTIILQENDPYDLYGDKNNGYVQMLNDNGAWGE